ncbi:DMT family transporter [Candidatus Woesearchaeota archaeon]|nr:DMT family transporter [Candidatus Woesearchaeota archaeon]
MAWKIKYGLISAILGAFLFLGEEIILRRTALTPYQLVVIMHVVGGLVLLVAAHNSWNEFRQMSAGNYVRIIAGSIILAAMVPFFLYSSIYLIGASKAVFLSRIELVFIIIFSTLFLKDAFRRVDYICFFLVFAGVILLTYDPAALSAFGSRGDWYVIGSSFLNAVGIVLLTPFFRTKNVLAITGLLMFLGGAILGIVLLLAGVSLLNSSAGWAVLLSLVLALAWLFFNKSIKEIGPSKTAMLYAAEAFITLFIAFFLQHYFPALGILFSKSILVLLAGGSLIVGGIVVMEYWRVKEGKKQISM